MIGLVVGAIRMGLDFGYGSPGCGEEDNRPLIISKVHFLHFTIILFFVSLISTIVISLATGPIDDKHVSMTLCKLPIECKYLDYRAAAIHLSDNRPLIISKVHFLHFTIILFFVSLISTIVISLATGPIDDKHVSMALRELPIECKYLYYRAATIHLSDNRPLIISKVHFLHFTIILFSVSLISTIVISLATGPIDDKHVSMTLCELPIECKYLYYRAATIHLSDTVAL